MARVSGIAPRKTFDSKYSVFSQPALDARDLMHFTKLLGFTPHEALISCTYGVAKLFMRSHEMGQIKVGNYADCVLVDGNPLDNIEVLQDHSKLNVIIINGRVHKAGRKEYVTDSTERTMSNGEFPEVKMSMQKDY